MTPGFGGISEADWTALNGSGAPKRLIETKADFAALADDSLTVDGCLIGIPPRGGTLQINRDPFTTPPIFRDIRSGSCAAGYRADAGEDDQGCAEPSGP